MPVGGEVRFRAMPPDVALRTYRKNQAFYDKILKERIPKDSQADPKATILLLSGCQDNQLSQDGAFNGLFTSQLLKVWKNGLFKGSYRGFHRAIVRRMPPDQTPNYLEVGRPNLSFLAQRPFSI